MPSFDRSALELAEAPSGEATSERSGEVAETSLDPDDWDAFRASLHAAADRAVDHLSGRREKPVWRPMDDAAKAAINEPLPIEPQGISKVIEDIETLVLPYDTGNTHPRFFGWVHGAGTAGGMVAELFAAALNANLGGRDHGAVYIERQVLSWACQMFGLPNGAGGLLVSGTSMATLIALTVARNTKSERDLRADGLSAQSRPLVGYTSAEAHSSVAKAFEILGLGARALRPIPVDGGFSMDVSALRDAIRKDIDAGNQPFAVIGTAGTVNTAAIDPLDELADVCRQHDLWFHVDGAFGGLAVIAPAQAGKVRGIERADSIAFDFHKWLHVPYDAGCVLLRDGDLQRRTFAARPDYLQGLERGLAGGSPWFCELGPELSRGFRALKVWLTIKEHGLARLGAMIERNCAQADYLAQRIMSERDLEILAPVSLNICCFRFTGGGLSDDQQDEVNREIVIRLQEKGVAAPSTTRIGGRLAIRVNITNHRTANADLDLLANVVLELGHDLLFAGEPDGTGDPASSANKRPDAVQTLPDVSVSDAMPILDRALSRPEIAPLAQGLSIEVTPRIDAVFHVKGSIVHLHPCAFDSAAAASVLLRHALELSLWQHAGEAQEIHQLVARSLACARTAALYLGTIPAHERADALAHLPPPLADVYRRLSEDHMFADLEALFGDTAIDVDLLLALENRSIQRQPAENVVRIRASTLLFEYAVLAAPVEALLARGGDQRIELIPEDRPYELWLFAASLPGRDQLQLFNSFFDRRQAVRCVRGTAPEVGQGNGVWICGGCICRRD